MRYAKPFPQISHLNLKLFVWLSIWCPLESQALSHLLHPIRFPLWILMAAFSTRVNHKTAYWKGYTLEYSSIMFLPMPHVDGFCVKSPVTGWAHKRRFCWRIIQDAAPTCRQSDDMQCMFVASFNMAYDRMSFSRRKKNQKTKRNEIPNCTCSEETPRRFRNSDSKLTCCLQICLLAFARWVQATHMLFPI